MDLKKGKYFQQLKAKSSSLSHKRSGDSGSIHKKEPLFSVKSHTKKESQAHGDSKQADITNCYLDEIKRRSFDSLNNLSQYYIHNKASKMSLLESKHAASLQHLQHSDLKTKDSKKIPHKKTDSISYRTLSYPNVRKEDLQTHAASEIKLFGQNNKASSVPATNIPLSESLTTSIQPDDQIPLLSIIEKLSLDKIYETKEQQTTDNAAKQTDTNCCKTCGKVFGDLNASAKKLAKIYFVTTLVFNRGKHKEVFQCKVCERTERLRNYIDKHILEHMANKELSCEECQLKIVPEKLNIVSEVRPLSKINKIVSESWFTEKLVNELSKIPINCKRCENEFCHADVLLQNLSCSEVIKKSSSEKRIEHIYICGLCSNRGVGKANSIIHICDHVKSGELHCESCQPYIINAIQSTTSFITLWPEEPVQCSSCNHTVEQDEVLSIDILSLNSNPEIKASNLNIVYICRICQFKSYQKNRMARHFKNHMEKNYIFCYNCQESKKQK